MKITIAVSLIAVCFLGFQSERSDFSGNWKLDKKKSSHLPESFTSVDSYVMNVRQTNDSMVTTVNMSGNGQHVTFPLTAYTFVGKEVFREDTLRGSKRWSKSTWETTGRKFIVESRVQLKKAKGDQEYTERAVWQLNDRKTMQLSITQHYVQGDSTHSERRIFRRVQ
jgi:hypothetical protein